MIYTNKRGLPEAYCNAVRRQPYDNEGTLSTTTLIRPPQLVQLEKKHWDEIETDVEDALWSLDGSADHYILELAKDAGDYTEFRLFWEMDGVRISGKPDLLTALGVLVDHKRTSVWVINDALKNGKAEWDQQLNINAELIRLNNDFLAYANCSLMPEPRALRVIARARDWRPSEAAKYDDYPHKIEIIKIEMWPREKCQEFIRDRIRLHSLETPPPCSLEERWAKPGQWAVMGKKKALRLLASEEDALQWASIEGIDNPKIEFRPGESFKRCKEGYCSVAKFCPQFNADQDSAEQLDE